MLIIKVILLFTVLGTLFLIGEHIRHKYKYGNEVSRKLVHILHGTGLAALAFLVPLWMIVVLELGFLVVVSIARYTYTHYRRKIPAIHYLGEMYRVGRQSYGEFFFPVSTILCAIFAQSNWVFASALLVLALADTTAALVGKAYGKSTTYEVFGQNKSIIGSLAFFAVAFAVICWFSAFSSTHPVANWSEILMLSLILTMAENVGVYGSDNFLIPITAVAALNLF